MGYYIDDANAVSKYAVINFKDSDGTVFKAVRCMLNESVDLPILMTNMNGELDPITFDKTYSFVGGWKDVNGQAVTNAIASGPYDFYTDVYGLKLYYVAVMETEAGGSPTMIGNIPFKIYSNKKIYLRYVELGGGITINPTMSHSYDSDGNIVNSVVFSITGIVDNPGEITSLEPVFKVYKDTVSNQEIGTIKFEIRIYHSSEQPSGD